MAIPWPVPAPPPPIDPALDYPYLASGRVVVQFALAQAPDLWGRARWSAGARWGVVNAANFVDATCDVEGLSIERGRRDSLDHYSTARLSMSLVDPSRRWSPGAIDENGIRPLRIGTPLRVAAWAADSSQLETMFAGVVEKVSQLDDGSEPTVALSAHGPLGSLSADTISAPTAGLWEMAGARMARVVAATNLRIDYWTTEFAPGVEPLNAFEEDDEATPTDLLYLVADSDGGALLERRDGALVYRSAGDLEGDPVKARFVDSGSHTGQGDDYCPASLTFSLDAANVVNDVGVANLLEHSYRARDEGSISWSGRRPVDVDQLLYINQLHGVGLAEQLLARASRSDFAVSPVLGEALAIPGWYRAALDLELTNRVVVDRDDGRGLRVEATCRIGNVRHDIGLESWTVRFDLEDAQLRTSWSRWGRARWRVDRWS